MYYLISIVTFVAILCRVVERWRIIKWLRSNKIEEVERKINKSTTLKEYIKLVKRNGAPNLNNNKFSIKIFKLLSALRKYIKSEINANAGLIIVQIIIKLTRMFQSVTSLAGITTFSLFLLYSANYTLPSNAIFLGYLFTLMSLLLFTAMILEVIRYPIHKINLGYDFMLFIDISNLGKNGRFLESNINNIPAKVRYGGFIVTYAKLIITIILTYAFIYYNYFSFCGTKVDKAFSTFCTFISYSTSSLVMAPLNIRALDDLISRSSLMIITASEMLIGFLLVILVITDFSLRKN